MTDPAALRQGIQKIAGQLGSGQKPPEVMQALRLEQIKLKIANAVDAGEWTEHETAGLISFLNNNN